MPMLVEILVPDRYLDHTNRAVNCAEGDILKTRVGYGKTLIAAGLARPGVVKMASEPATTEGGAAVANLDIAKMNIEAVLEAIKDGDFTPEEALEAELGQGKKARSSLVQKLEKIIGFDEAAEGGDEANS